MADRNDNFSSIVSQEGAGRRAHTIAAADGEPIGSVVVEFLDAARSAAESLLEEQKRQVADRVSGIAEALHSAAHSLEQSQNQTIARYIAQAGEQLGQMSRTMHERRWAELVADTDDFARRRPTLFVLAAVAAGFLAGRLLWASTGGPPWSGAATEGGSRSDTSRAVTAAVSSGSGTAGGVAGYAAGSSGAVEVR